MSSRWQTNRIGLINFWYYDEQEFYFSKGRMLLRGSNGSGKSVTMQSVVPLLLDGNLSPERLDPFGSRDRKMSNYLLDEEDNRDERTGYLYLEFKRAESETYLTIGMGMRARKGKALDKWYFSITDGRRIGYDFHLYKEMGEKVTLSKLELEYRVREGGHLFERQSDYMEYVNRQIFGFETVEEYKEMIDLLIQLRTPKLSKDFKPSVINEILSDSLQPLSDEDLRPMSEAIENMDTQNMNLKSKEEGEQAAEKINRIFKKYNQLLLYEKSNRYVACCKKADSLTKESKEQEKQLTECENHIQEQKKLYGELYIKNEAMEKEKESLSQSDAVVLKETEIELEGRLKQSRTSLQEKEKQLTEKQEKYIETESRQKETQGRQEIQKDALYEMMEEMREEADAMSFQEHEFLCSELKEGFEASFSFDTHSTLTQQWRENIEKGCGLLREEEERRRHLDEQIQEMDGEKRNADSIERRVNECKLLFTQVQNELKELFYGWNTRNKELQISKEEMAEVSDFIDRYGQDSDFNVVRERVSDVYLQRKGTLQSAQYKVKELLEEAKDTIRELEKEKKTWVENRQPQPERSDEVLKNRQMLKEKGIPYLEFYQIIEFDDALTKEQCDSLEEALLHMGILDALVVEEQYREKVLHTDKGQCDKYLFVQKQRAEKSLLEMLNLNDSVNDIFSNQRITGILENIAYDGEGEVAIYSDGSYRMGVLMGTVTREYEAGFIGTQARERNRLAKIAKLQEEISQTETVKKKLEAEITEWEQKLQTLQAEYEVCPDDKDIREAWNILEETRQTLKYSKERIYKMEDKVREMTSAIQEIRKKAATVAEKLYLSCTYETFQHAEEAVREYERKLNELKYGHGVYLNFKSRTEDFLEQMEALDADMDTIRYDKAKINRDCESENAQLDSVRQQLELTDYKEIQERLNHCLEWLGSFNKRVETCIKEQTNQENRKEQLLEHKTRNHKAAKELEQQRTFLKTCFDQEFGLKYVDIPEEMQQAETVLNYLTPIAAEMERDVIIQRLNQVYFENKSFLNEYQLTQTEVFQELDEEAEREYPTAKRMDIYARYRGTKINFQELLQYLGEEIEELKQLIREKDRELFEDILTNTVSRKIRGKINGSNTWVEKMNNLMGSMNTSSGLKLSLRWRSKTAETENQLDTKELVSLLKKDYRSMREEEAQKLSLHFRSKVEEARRSAKDSGGMVSFYQVMKDTLDYRKWFEFQLFSQKSGERQKELTNSVFGTFSGGEKAMAMYVPLFSAVVAKYKGGHEDAPRLISLDEAFAGVDNKNIRDMFRLMTEFEFNFIINSQVLWGDCDTLDSLAIYQLIRPENVKFVTVMSYHWDGKTRILLEQEREMQVNGI